MQEAEGGAWCRTEIIFRPQQPPPAEMYERLGLHRRGIRRGAAHLSLWARDVARELNATLDRTNAMGVADCLLVSFVGALLPDWACVFDQDGSSRLDPCSGRLIQMVRGIFPPAML